jgi:hypothetical protein
MSVTRPAVPRPVVDLNGQLSLHPQFSSAVVPIGAEGVSVLVVDNFLSRPQVLVDYAASCVFEGVSDTFYPGVRAPIPAIYCFALRAFLGRLIVEAFGLASERIVGELAHFSLVTTPPADLSVPQRLPHIDNTDPGQLAVLHYLCGPEHGGTSFYRHRRTRLEFVDHTRSALYRQGIAEDLASTGPPPPCYICGDSPLFERTASFAAAYNRLLVYRSINLHSADIGPGFRFDPDARSGRLTANTFFYYR